MQEFTGFQYLLIDAANNYGLDKLLFHERIEWANKHLAILEQVAPNAEKYPQFMKAVMAIRKAQAKQPTGHVVGLDAICSGIQIMSALTGDLDGARNTGLIDPHVRADAYTKLYQTMRSKLGNDFEATRKEAKDALMTMFYGSKQEPVKIFGADTVELDAFYQSAYELAPGAWETLQDLLGAWQPYALVHEWLLPDGFHARVKVMKKIESPDPRARIEVDELDHATFTYEYKINEGTKTGISLPANVIHSVDAYIMRTMHRRCNYDKPMVMRVYEVLCEEHVQRLRDDPEYDYPTEDSEMVEYYVGHYQRSTVADITILPYLDHMNVHMLSTELIEKLIGIITSMLDHAPFEIITVHDEFKAHPNNLNHLRRHYINIFAELAESDLLSDILSQLHGTPGKVAKLSDNLGTLIRGSNYALS